MTTPQPTDVPETPAPTGGEQPSPATPEQPKGGTPTPSEQEQPEISKEERSRRDLQSQRDREREARKTDQERLNDLEAAEMQRREEHYQKIAIDNLLKDKNRYPDLTYEDLKHIWNPDMLEEEADRLQARLQDHAQKKVLEIENPHTVHESPEQRAAREAELMKNGGPDALEKMIAGRMSPTS